MKIIGVPTCPYCRKSVNLIRTWNLKKHGEYRCPKCRGISNIYLSPLVYILAVIAIGAGVMVYFFDTYITNTLSLMTIPKVFVPFALFFLLSLFTVYLEVPKIKRVRKTADGRYFDEEGNEMQMKGGKLKPTGKKYAQFAVSGDTYSKYDDAPDFSGVNGNGYNPDDFSFTGTTDVSFAAGQYEMEQMDFEQNIDSGAQYSDYDNNYDNFDAAIDAELHSDDIENEQYEQYDNNEYADDYQGQYEEPYEETYYEEDEGVNQENVNYNEFSTNELIGDIDGLSEFSLGNSEYSEDFDDDEYGVIDSFERTE